MQVCEDLVGGAKCDVAGSDSLNETGEGQGRSDAPVVAGPRKARKSSGMKRSRVVKGGAGSDKENGSGLGDVMDDDEDDWEAAVHSDENTAHEETAAPARVAKITRARKQSGRLVGGS
jgi:hypothetical protein